MIKPDDQFFDQPNVMTSDDIRRWEQFMNEPLKVCDMCLRNEIHLIMTDKGGDLLQINQRGDLWLCKECE